MHLGLSASAFCSLPAEKVIDLACQNGLTVLEWNDEHIPFDNIEEAARIQRLTEEKGLKTVSYASKFPVMDEKPEAFEAVLQIAQTLGTDTICLRTELPDTEDKKEQEEATKKLAESIAHLADMAGKIGIKLCIFCLQDTIFDDYRRAVQLMELVGRPNVFLNWQPKLSTSLIFNIFELKMLKEHVHHVYIAYTDSDSRHSLLVEEKDEWQQYIKVLKEKKERALLFRACSAHSFREDCALLRDWVLEICSD
ncbi:MAG: TIM barrel protein [Clostridia bacterium]|nr:TIM barrel protein [Clostridia bacterium]